MYNTYGVFYQKVCKQDVILFEVFYEKYNVQIYSSSFVSNGILIQNMLLYL